MTREEQNRQALAQLQSLLGQMRGTTEARRLQQLYGSDPTLYGRYLGTISHPLMNGLLDPITNLSPHQTPYLGQTAPPTTATNFGGMYQAPADVSRGTSVPYLSVSPRRGTVHPCPDLSRSAWLTPKGQRAFAALRAWVARLFSRLPAIKVVRK